MLLLTEALFEYGIDTPDDGIGRCRDLYFDDRDWSVRYVVVDTGRLLPGRKVLLSPQVFGPPEADAKKLPTGLTQEQVKNGPTVGEHEPVSRRHEKALARYFNWQVNWLPPIGPYPPPTGLPSTEAPVYDALGAGNRPPAAPGAPAGNEPGEVTPPPESEAATEDEAAPDAHLRGVRELTGYDADAGGEVVGAIDDALVETDVWRIAFLVIDTGGWLSGKKVLVGTGDVDRLEWSGRLVHVTKTRKELEDAPAFDPTAPVNEAVEHSVYDYAGRRTD